MASRAVATAYRPALVHVGRQPILTATGSLYGYELLFRATAQATAATVGGVNATPDAATTATILSAFSEFGSQLLGGRLGFVNLTRAFIVGDLPVPFPPSAAVLEVLETVRIDDDVIKGARARVAEGHRLALDDFVWSDGAPALLELADIVKFDVLEPSWEEVLDTVERCRPFGVRLLAERVEDAATVDRALQAGFELFQGYYFGRPQTLSMESLGPRQAIALRMLARLSDPTTTDRQVEQLLCTDPALTFRLLRIANSAHSGLQRRVASIRDAVVLVGLARLESWMLLLAMNPGGGQSERISSALVRAKTCELVAVDARADSAFTLGLLHGISEALGVAPEAFVAGLPALADDLTSALIGDAGPLSTVLESVLAYERADPGELPPDPVHGHSIAAAYMQALAWTTATMAGVHRP